MINRRELMIGAVAVSGVAVLPLPAAALAPDGWTLDRLTFLRREYAWLSRAALMSWKARTFTSWTFEESIGNPASCGRRLATAYGETDDPKHVYGGSTHPVARDWQAAFLDICDFTDGWASFPCEAARFFADHPAAVVDRIALVDGGVAQRRAAITEGRKLMDTWWRKISPSYCSAGGLEHKLMFYSKDQAPLTQSS